MRAWASVLLLVSALLSVAHAVEDPDTELARRYFELGRKAYEASDYAKALAAFLDGRRVSPLPGFDYNIARCHDRLDHPAEAVQAYEAYLKREPAGPSANEARARIAVLKHRAPPSAATPTPALAVVATQRPRSTRRFLAPGLVLGGTLVVAVIGAGLLGSVPARLDQINAAWDRGEGTEALRAEGLGLERQATAGYAMLGVAGALAVADVTLWALSGRF